MRKLVVAMLLVAVGIIVVAPAGASAKKPTLKLKSDSQAKILKKGAIKVKVKGLKKGKLKIKAKSSTFDNQTLHKFAQKTKVKAGKKKTVRMPLTAKGQSGSPPARPARW